MLIPFNIIEFIAFGNFFVMNIISKRVVYIP